MSRDKPCHLANRGLDRQEGRLALLNLVYEGADRGGVSGTRDAHLARLRTRTSCIRSTADPVGPAPAVPPPLVCLFERIRVPGPALRSAAVIQRLSLVRSSAPRRACSDPIPSQQLPRRP